LLCFGVGLIIGRRIGRGLLISAATLLEAMQSAAPLAAAGGDYFQVNYDVFF
jgi:hypothetical protein